MSYSFSDDIQVVSTVTTKVYLLSAIVTIVGFLGLGFMLYANHHNMLIATPFLFIIQSVAAGAYVVLLIFLYQHKMDVFDTTTGTCYQYSNFIDGSVLKNNCIRFWGSYNLFVIFTWWELAWTVVSVGVLFASHLDIAYRVQVQGEKERLGFYA